MVSPSRALEVRAGIRACRACELYAVGSGPIPPRGPLSPELLVVGEAPGQTEDKEGRPFIGPSGLELNKLLSESGLDPLKTLFYNSVACYPKGTPTPEHIDKCRLNVRGVVSAYSLQVILSVGRVSFSSLVPQYSPDDLKYFHGKPLWMTFRSFPADRDTPIQAVMWPTYHPAAALRNRHYRATIASDLRNLVAYHKEGKDLWGDYWTGCYLCGKEVERWDDLGVPVCERHLRKQGILFQ